MNTVISIETQAQIVGEVVSRLKSVLKISDIALGKMVQNVKINCIGLLGKSIPSEMLMPYCEALAKSYIDSFVNRAECIGISAAQSLGQPITQATLKAQHEAGKKSTSDDSTLIKLNSLKVHPRVINLHVKSDLLDAKSFDMHSWAKRNEYTCFGEVIACPCGEAKYIPKPIKRQQDTFVEYRSRDSIYINVPKTNNVFYIFRIDPSKLWDVNLTPLELFDVIFTIEGLGLVIHPVQSFTFEICPNKIDLATFNEKIQTLLTTRLKGIRGIETIDVKKIKVSDVIKYNYYDPNTRKSHLFLDPELMTMFPRDQLINKLGLQNISHQFSRRGEPLSLIVDGTINDTLFPTLVYQFFSLRGTMTLNDILGLVEKTNQFRLDYLVSNDPSEMTDFLGMSVAQTYHELNYHRCLQAGKISIDSAHIMVLCGKMFGYNLKPITPQGFENDEGVTPLDKCAAQNLRKHLTVEPVMRERKYPARSLVATTILGARYKFGSNYAKTEINETARQRVIEMCSEARTEQYYAQKGTTNSRYIGIDFFGVGKIIKHKTGLSRTLVLSETNDFDF
jgi:hypothetical protein